jgi:hypothetical protein
MSVEPAKIAPISESTDTMDWDTAVIQNGGTLFRHN